MIAFNCCNWGQGALATYFPHPADYFLESELDYLEAHHWEIMTDMAIGGLQNTANCEQYIEMAHELIDHGIPVTCGIEQMFGHCLGIASPDGYLGTQPYTTRGIPTGNIDTFSTGTVVTPTQFHTTYGLWPSQYWDTPEEEYENRFGDCIELLNDSDIYGFMWEDGFDNGISWLRGATSKKLCQYLDYSDPPITPPGGNNDPRSSYYLYPTATADQTARAIVNPSSTHNEAWRLSQVDEVVMEQYASWPYDNSRDFITNCATNHPSLPIGVTSTYGVVPTVTLWWGDETGQAYTNDMQQARMKAEYNHLDTLAAGGLSLIEVGGGYYWTAGWGYLGTPDAALYPPYDYFFSAFAIVDFMESFTMQRGTGAGTYPTQPVQPLSEQGYVPYYCGASRCTAGTAPPDTFTNTGNEVIMLKSYSGNTNHTITVSGTLPNGLTKTQSYTRTLSPNQGTPLGPFPVDQFGSLPTITYDNTNLYVAIVGAWRTGFEPL